PGIIGYEDSVLPQVENALLSGQDIVFLGERGQAKTKIARLMVNLLDAEVPALAGCETNDEPFAPISQAGHQLVGEHGDRPPLLWLPRDRRDRQKPPTPET